MRALEAAVAVESDVLEVLVYALLDESSYDRAVRSDGALPDACPPGDRV